MSNLLGMPRRQPAGPGLRRGALRPSQRATESPAYPAGCSSSVGAGAAQVLAGLDDTGRHVGLCLFAPGARVVLLLVADLAVDLQDTVVVGHHVAGDRA